MIVPAIIGVVIIILSIPLALGKVGPNNAYGFRVQATLTNPDVWYKVNSYFGKALAACGVVMIILSEFAPKIEKLTGLTAGNYTLAVILIPVSLAVGLTYRYMYGLPR